MPAWFAHQNKVNNPVNRDLNFSPSSSNDVKISPTQFYKKLIFITFISFDINSKLILNLSNINLELKLLRSHGNMDN